jgi:hypothetical protein
LITEAKKFLKKVQYLLVISDLPPALLCLATFFFFQWPQEVSGTVINWPPRAERNIYGSSTQLFISVLPFQENEKLGGRGVGTMQQFHYGQKDSVTITEY